MTPVMRSHLLVIPFIVIAVCIAATAGYAAGSGMPGSRAQVPYHSGNVLYSTDIQCPPPMSYTGIHFDTLHPNTNLTVIPVTAFQQQQTDYTCGPAAAMTVLSYYGVPLIRGEIDEFRIAREMHISTTEAIGATPVQITDWFLQQGWDATWGTDGSRDLLRKNLDSGIPTMVEWIDWGGHWVVVAGYDTRGTETIWDDVIIFADTADCHDDRVDGITYFNYGEFEAMWFDAHYMPEGMRNRVYVVATPPGGVHGDPWFSLPGSAGDFA